jgi:hypothetical protein
MIVLIVIILLFSGIWLYQDFAGGIDTITGKIKRPWLKFALRIVLKIVTITFIVAGIVATAFIAMIMAYNPKKKK